ncbi:MAG: DNA polymerase III subunit gamma/tau [Bacteroidota bacterium]
MDNFIVSARKYRPDNFDTVVGQDSITTTLKNSIKIGHLAHAYLFCGPRGVGKTTCARIFAKTINCSNITEKSEACNTCDSCKSFNKSGSFNIHELDAASNNSVDDIRNLIEQVRIPPQLGSYSVYIIDEVHMLSNQAFNSFLKTLEEPPRHAIFILATTEKHKIIPTIISRCQIFDFQRISLKDIEKQLQFVAKSENIVADPDGLNIIAQKADGALRDALSIFDQIVSFSGNEFTYDDVISNLNIIDYEYYFQAVNNFLNNDITSSLKLYDQILKKGFEGSGLISGLSRHMRDLLVCKDNETIVLLEVGKNVQQRYLSQANTCSPDFLFKALMILGQADFGYKTSSNKRLHIELTLLQLCRIIENALPERKIDLPSRQVDDKIEKNNLGESKRDENKPETETIEEKQSENVVKESNKKNYTSSTPTIKNEINGLYQSKEKSSEEISDQFIDSKSAIAKNEPFTSDDLLKTWSEIADRFKEKETRKFTLLTTNSITLRENSTIEFSVSSMIQKEKFEKELFHDVLNELKNKLSNDSINLNILVKEVEQSDSKKLYTDDDKYNHLKEINPKLDNLKQQFNLDFN